MTRTIEEIKASAEKKKLKEMEISPSIDDMDAMGQITSTPVQEKTFSEDLISKISPIASSVSDKVKDFSDMDFVNEGQRQLGLTARSLAEGGASLGGVVYDPVASLINLASSIIKSTTGANVKTEIPRLSDQMSVLLNEIGVPEPENTKERIVNMVGQGMTTGGGSATLATKIANYLSGTSQKVARLLASNRGTQVTGGAGAGGSAQATAEAGYGPVAQTGAAVLGGLATGKVTNVKTDPVPSKVKAIAKEAEDINVPVLTSDVKAPVTFAGKWLQETTEVIPIVGTGLLRRSQNEARQDAVLDLSRKFGVDLGDDVEIISAVQKDLKRKRGSELDKYVNLKSSVIDSKKLNTAGSVDVSKTVAAIDQEIDKLSRLRSGEFAPVIARLKDWRSSILGEKTIKGADGKDVIVREGQTLEYLEMLRKQIGESFADPSLASVKKVGQKSLDKIYGPLRDDMRSFIITFGNKNDIKKFDLSNARLSELVGDLESSLFKNVLKKGEITTEEVARLLFSKKPSEVRLLHKNLDEAGRANARTAIITDMFKKSLNADESISPERFRTEIKKTSTQLGIFFEGKDLQSVLGLGRVLSLTQRAASANINPPTGRILQIPILGAILSNMTGGIGTTTGMIGAGSIAVTVGGIARILESPAVREILIKLPKLKPGSPLEAEFMKRLDDTILLEFGDSEISSEETADSSALQSIIERTDSETRDRILQQV
jgi:hypothetical protein